MSDQSPAASEAGKKFSIELPTEIAPPLQEVPSTLLIYGLPKCGKTTEIAKLPNSLIIDPERGSGFVACKRIQPPEGLGPVAMFNWVREVAKAIRAQDRPYDFVSLETVSLMDELSEWAGTWNYMNSVQGEKFNRFPTLTEARTPHPKAGQRIKFGDPDYQSVHDMGKGFGYRWSRAVMTELFKELRGLGRICTIFTCHTAEKQIVSKITNTEVMATDLSLTGKVKTIWAREVDAIAYVYNRDGQLQISFKGSEEKVGGMRGGTHLQGYEGPVNWEQIFKLSA